MNFHRKKLMAGILSSSLLFPILSGCSSTVESTNNTQQKTTTTGKVKKDAKSIATAMQQSLKDVKKAIAAKNNDSLKKSAELLNQQWLENENRIRDSYPLLYTEIEKYLMPLYAAATSNNPDKKILNEMADSLKGSLAKLANAKEMEKKNSAFLTQAIDQYKQYVFAETDQLVKSTQSFIEAVKAKDVPKAKSLYVESRSHYERIEPIAESFGDLDPKIDAREGDVDPSEWGGFHRIEKALWNGESLDEMAKVADKLNQDILLLQEKVKNVSLNPAQFVAGAMELINEAAISKITGEEERFAHVDLMDLSANVDGAFAIYTAIQPYLIKQDQELSVKLDQQFSQLATTLTSYKTNGQYVLYTDLTKEQIRDLSQKLSVLSELMGQTAKILA
ncbi:iron uptake system protein EfeO [Neobacillus sp. SM06]|uniref:iron uptake system protein EfeO n=1 Tax=Neobacillus sp. SM06 TaxID=3422492 RepID=UPI003D2AE2F0